jgi:23S rRNA (uracil-5-)-methyltransferase RumA
MGICVHKDFCGGCIYQGILYEEQLRIKNNLVEKLLDQRDLYPVEHLGFQPAPQIYRYRNKMEYTFGDMVKGGPITLGLHQKGHFMNVVTVDECQLVDEDFNVILDAMLTFVEKKGYKSYNKKSHQGLLRHLVLRKGERTGELLIHLVTSTQGTFDDQGFLDLLLNLTPYLKNTIIGVLHTYNDNKADAVKSDRTELLFGRDYYKEKIMGLDFQVGAFSFFQTNVWAAERLYQEALSILPEHTDKVMVDLYCGTGTISQALATKARKVIGVEIVEDAVISAVKNAKSNGLENCEFIHGDVMNVVSNLPDQANVLVVDPPRNGIHPKALKQIMDLNVQEILYISCNPNTMTEDLVVLKQAKYELLKWKAYDNFPFTKHIEAVAYLTKTE